MVSRIFALLAFALCCSLTHAEEVVEIPLSEIWSYDRAERELEPELFIKLNTPEIRAEYSTPEKRQELLDKARSSLTWQIQQAMNHDVLDLHKARYPEDRRPAPCFAVAGNNREVWGEIYGVVVKGQKPRTQFSSKDKISLVFFSLMSNPRPRLKQVIREGTKIKFKYVLPMQQSLDIRHLLFVTPLGPLPPGRYEVTPARAHAAEATNDTRTTKDGRGIEQSFVCQPFEFTVEKGVEE